MEGGGDGAEELEDDRLGTVVGVVRAFGEESGDGGDGVELRA